MIKPDRHLKPLSLYVLSLASVVALAAVLIAPTASAQGTCSCNSGCHMYPGQCVQSGSSGCTTGYAAFCGTRAASCPRMGWVSCNGVCTCVRIPGFDAGTPDVVSPDVVSPDVVITDVLAPDVLVTDVVITDVLAPDVLITDAGITDVLAPDVLVTDGAVSDTPRIDASMPDVFIADFTPAVDSVRPVDAPTIDGAPPPDTLVPSDRSMSTGDLPTATDVLMSLDTPAATDAPIAPMDSTAMVDTATALDGTTDVQCVCPGGVCIAERCITDRCMYHPELGFICTLPGTACRLIGSEPYCVPVCLGVSCVAGEFCDDTSNGRCVRDECSTIQCPAGTTCRRNQCGRFDGPDGSFAFSDIAGDGVTGDGGLNGNHGVDDGGCGCRASSRRSGGGAFALGLVAFALGARRRRRSGLWLISGIFALGLAGCGASGGTTPAVDSGVDPNTVGFSGPVSIRLDKFKDNDVRNEAFDADKEIDTQPGNPYGLFLRGARTALGRDAAAVLVDSITITLGSDSRGVTAFEQIFTGTAVVYFATSSVTVNVGTLSMPTGAGPASVQVNATRTDLAPINAALTSGHFKVGMRVPAAAGRPMSFDVKVSMTLYFRALAQ